MVPVKNEILQAAPTKGNLSFSRPFYMVAPPGIRITVLSVNIRCSFYYADEVSFVLCAS